MKLRVLVKTSVFAFDGCHDEKQEPKGQFREWLLQSSSPFAAVTVAAASVAAVPVLNVG